MLSDKTSPDASHYGILLALLAAVILAAWLPLPWDRALENQELDTYFTLRGERDLSDDFVLVFLGDDDLEDLGGWPITRDYYGYMSVVLQELGARVIAFDVLFSRENTEYPEYDRVFADLIIPMEAVVLPMTFGAVNYPLDTAATAQDNLPKGSNPQWPIDVLENNASTVGYSNLENEAVIRRIPLFIQMDEDPSKIVPSLGAAIANHFQDAGEQVKPGDARLVDGLDAHSRLLLNHFGGFDRIQSISFVDLLQVYEKDSVEINLNDKIVMVAATAAGLPVMQSTPLAERLPASLIHATAAENLLENNYIRQATFGTLAMVILFAGLGSAMVWMFAPRRWIFPLVLLIPLILIGVSLGSFGQANFFLPLFYPFIAFLVVNMYMIICAYREEQLRSESSQGLLKSHLAQKETQLSSARENLSDLESQLEAQSASSQTLADSKSEYQQQVRDLEKQLRDLKETELPPFTEAAPEMQAIVHAPSGKLASVLNLVSRVKQDDIPVLIVGETGTGKELIARMIHSSGQRSENPFIAINCGALSETLLESELFGHEKGSFTGAVNQRRGRFELADSGTLFLDEISETTPAFQARLLRVLQEGVFERLGSEKSIKVDVRIIAACNVDLQTEIDAGRFRADLFYRLNGFPIQLPPLRERREDLPLLINHFLGKYGNEKVSGVSEAALESLERYAWPGNVRELENVVRRAALLAQTEGRRLLQASDLPEEITSASIEKLQAFSSTEEQVLSALRLHKFGRSSISETARMLGNKDRGTITEYLRGICFQTLVASDYDIDKAVAAIADSNDEAVVEKVRKKVEGYLKNLEPLPDVDAEDFSPAKTAQFKGLPRKFHSALCAVIRHLQEKT